MNLRTESPSVRKNEGRPWFEFCRAQLEWLSWQMDMDVPRYVETLVDRAKRMHVNLLLFPADSGGYLLYPSSLAPRDSHIGDVDLIGMLADQAHAASLRFGICLLGAVSSTYVSAEHPEWVVRTQDGAPAPTWPAYKFRSLCLRSPFLDYYATMLSEVLSRYRVDAVYLEGIGGGECSCAYCQEQFRAQHHLDLLEAAVAGTREYRVFLQDGATEFIARIRAAINERSPDTALIACAARGVNVRAIAPLVDVVSMECQWGYGALGGNSQNWAFQETGLVMRLLRAQGQRPVLGTTWTAKNVDWDYAPRSEAHVRLCFNELLFNGATAQVHTQNQLEADDTLMPVIGELFSSVEQLRPYLAGATALRYAALVDWPDPRDYLNNYFDARYDEFRGFAKALSEGHLPVDLLPFEAVAPPALEGFSVVVLPDAARLSADAAGALAAWVERGGGLVYTDRTGLGDARAGAVLDRLAGIERQATEDVSHDDAFPPHRYYRVERGASPWAELSGTLGSYQGAWCPHVVQEGSAVRARIHLIDEARAQSSQILRAAFPSERVDPLVVTKEHGRGRVAYIAGSLAASLRRFVDPLTASLLRATVRWAGGEPPFSAACPPTVEVSTWVGERTAAVLLLNLTTNQLCSDAVIAGESASRLCSAPIHTVITLHRVGGRLRLGDRPPVRVHTLSGRACRTTFEAPWLSFELDSLEAGDGLLIDLA